MPNILALDTSGAACSVALQFDGQLHSRCEMAARSHTQKLLPMVDEVLQSAGTDLKHLDAIAFGCGPGSFTGLRIACGVAQGLGFGANLPLIPVSSLATLAAQVFAKTPNADNCLAAFDARMQQIYVALFSNGNGLPQLIGEEQVIEPEAYELPTFNGGLDCAGTGMAYVEKIALPIANTIDSEMEVDAKYMLPLAQAKFERGEAVDAAMAEPVYIRQQISWQKQQA